MFCIVVTWLVFHIVISSDWTFHLFLVVSAAIATVVTVAEILKNNGLAVEKSMVICFPIFLVQQSSLDFCTYLTCALCRDHDFNSWYERWIKRAICPKSQGKLMQYLFVLPFDYFMLYNIICMLCEILQLRSFLYWSSLQVAKKD